jgi:hypothetical protein
MTEGPFVGIDLSIGKEQAHIFCFDPSQGRTVFEHRFRDADLGDRDLAAVETCRRQDVAPLECGG